MILNRLRSSHLHRFPSILVGLLAGLAGNVGAQAISPINQDQPIELANFDYCTPTAQTPGHPHPQFRLPIKGFKQKTANGVTTVKTLETCLPEPKLDPFTLPPGTNLLANVYTNMFDGNNKEMPNTLPSTPNIPYNLHDGNPVVTTINHLSPNDDLREIIFDLLAQLERAENKKPRKSTIKKNVKRAIDILEGNPIADRAYSGYPVLHYNGPDKIKKVDKKTKTVEIYQIWYDEHIESDTAFVDPSEVLDEPWFIEYTIDTLSRGEDDFSPFVMYTDDPKLTDPAWRDHLPGRGRLPHIGMDQTFFPMQEGTRTKIRIKMAPGKYLKLSYTWGWRMHPPRIQVVENALRTFPGTPAPSPEEPNPPAAMLYDTQGNPVEQRTLPDWERHVFGDNPTKNQDTKEAAIAKIGDLSPAKRMWTAFRAARKLIPRQDWPEIRTQIENARDAYFDWRTRSRLPSGVKVDPDSDMTLLYVNNTIYGEFSDSGGPIHFPEVRWPDWTKRGNADWEVTLNNGDYYRHAYISVDFGGARGWENQFKSSTKIGGSGCWFTFGRAHWMLNQPKPIVLAPATKGGTEVHRMVFTFNYEPSTRLRFYQFDQMHHDVGIYSIH